MVTLGLNDHFRFGGDYDGKKWTNLFRVKNSSLIFLRGIFPRKISEINRINIPIAWFKSTKAPLFHSQMNSRNYYALQ